MSTGAIVEAARQCHYCRSAISPLRRRSQRPAGSLRTGGHPQARLGRVGVHVAGRWGFAVRRLVDEARTGLAFSGGGLEISGENERHHVHADLGRIHASFDVPPIGAVVPGLGQVQLEGIARVALGVQDDPDSRPGQKALVVSNDHTDRSRGQPDQRAHREQSLQPDEGPDDPGVVSPAGPGQEDVQGLAADADPLADADTQDGDGGRSGRVVRRDERAEVPT